MKKNCLLIFFILIISINNSIKTSLEYKKTLEKEPIQIFSKNENKKIAKKLSKWITPNENLRYDQICYLATHNCNSAYNYGYKPYAQQKWNIEEQLQNGIRTFLPDLWPTEIETNKELKRKENETINEYSKNATIRMCHGKCSINPFMRPANFLKNLIKLKKLKKMTLPLFSDMLETVNIFLNKNKNEIITLILENYADRDLLDYCLEQIPGLTNLIFKPNDWNFVKNNGNWPTIKWMKSNNKRLVIFNDNCFIEKLKKVEPTKYTLPIWKYIIENEFGKVDSKARTERGQSYDRKRYHHGEENEKMENKFPRKLLLLNYFITFPIPLEHKKNLIKFLKTFKNNTEYTKLNTIGIESLINYVYLNGLDKRKDKPHNSDLQLNKFPNFIALDFVNKGNAMEIVNYINKKQEEKTLKIYRSKDTELIENKESIITKAINKIKNIFLPGY